MTNGEAPKRPVPVSNALTQPFWDATKEERLTVMRCKDCDRLVWYPREFCPHPHCFSNNMEWVEVSGKGRLHTFTIIAQAQDPWFQEKVPYIFGVIQLDDPVAKYLPPFGERGKEAEETCRLVEEAGGRAVPFRADVSRSDEVIGMAGEVAKRLGPIAVLINNAGIARMIAPEDLTEADWDETLSVNLKSAFLRTQAVLPGMRSARWGRIVNVSSNAAFTGGRVGPHYAASKAGMNGLTHAYAASLAGEGITVNSVAPGSIRTRP